MVLDKQLLLKVITNEKLRIFEYYIHNETLNSLTSVSEWKQNKYLMARIKKYDQIANLEWILTNGYIGLLKDKIVNKRDSESTKRIMSLPYTSVELVMSQVKDPIIIDALIAERPLLIKDSDQMRFVTDLELFKRLEREGVNPPYDMLEMALIHNCPDDLIDYIIEKYPDQRFKESLLYIIAERRVRKEMPVGEPEGYKYLYQSITNRGGLTMEQKHRRIKLILERGNVIYTQLSISSESCFLLYCDLETIEKITQRNDFKVLVPLYTVSILLSLTSELSEEDFNSSILKADAPLAITKLLESMKEFNVVSSELMVRINHNIDSVIRDVQLTPYQRCLLQLVELMQVMERGGPELSNIEPQFKSLITTLRHSVDIATYLINIERKVMLSHVGVFDLICGYGTLAQVQRAHEEMVKLNSDGKTSPAGRPTIEAMTMAAEQGKLDIVQFLNINRREQCSSGILDVTSNHKIVKYLIDAKPKLTNIYTPTTALLTFDLENTRYALDLHKDQKVHISRYIINKLFEKYHQHHVIEFVKLLKPHLQDNHALYHFLSQSIFVGAYQVFEYIVYNCTSHENTPIKSPYNYKLSLLDEAFVHGRHQFVDLIIAKGISKYTVVSWKFHARNGSLDKYRNHIVVNSENPVPGAANEFVNEIIAYGNMNLLSFVQKDLSEFNEMNLTLAVKRGKLNIIKYYMDKKHEKVQPLIKHLFYNAILFNQRNIANYLYTKITNKLNILSAKNINHLVYLQNSDMIQYAHSLDLIDPEVISEEKFGLAQHSIFPHMLNTIKSLGYNPPPVEVDKDDVTDRFYTLSRVNKVNSQSGDSGHQNNQNNPNEKTKLIMSVFSNRVLLYNILKHTRPMDLSVLDFISMDGIVHQLNEDLVSPKQRSLIIDKIQSKQLVVLQDDLLHLIKCFDQVVFRLVMDHYQYLFTETYIITKLLPAAITGGNIMAITNLTEHLLKLYNQKQPNNNNNNNNQLPIKLQIEVETSPKTLLESTMKTIYYITNCYPNEIEIDCKYIGDFTYRNNMHLEPNDFIVNYTKPIYRMRWDTYISVVTMDADEEDLVESSSLIDIGFIKHLHRQQIPLLDCIVWATCASRIDVLVYILHFHSHLFATGDIIPGLMDLVASRGDGSFKCVEFLHQNVMPTKSTNDQALMLSSTNAINGCDSIEIVKFLLNYRKDGFTGEAFSQPFDDTLEYLYLRRSPEWEYSGTTAYFTNSANKLKITYFYTNIPYVGTDIELEGMDMNLELLKAHLYMGMRAEKLDFNRLGDRGIVMDIETQMFLIQYDYRHERLLRHFQPSCCYSLEVNRICCEQIKRHHGTLNLGTFHQIDEETPQFPLDHLSSEHIKFIHQMHRSLGAKSNLKVNTFFRILIASGMYHTEPCYLEAMETFTNLFDVNEWVSRESMTMLMTNPSHITRLEYVMGLVSDKLALEMSTLSYYIGQIGSFPIYKIALPYFSSSPTKFNIMVSNVIGNAAQSGHIKLIKNIVKDASINNYSIADIDVSNILKYLTVSLTKVNVNNLDYCINQFNLDYQGNEVYYQKLFTSAKKSNRPDLEQYLATKFPSVLNPLLDEDLFTTQPPSKIQKS